VEAAKKVHDQLMTHALELLLTCAPEPSSVLRVVNLSFVFASL
jgi:hypothetical protein